MIEEHNKINLCEVIKELATNHIELVKEKDKCYFRIKGSKGKEKSFTSYSFMEWWERYFEVVEQPNLYRLNMENCKNCEHLIVRDICYFCECNGAEVEKPHLMGGSKKCECYEKSIKQSKKFQYPKKKTQ